MWRLRAEWSGAPITGPGLSTFYALDTSPGFPAAVHDFLAAFAPLLPSGVSIRVPNGGDVIDPSTGTLTGAWTDGSPPALVNGVGGGVFARGVGMQVRWRTTGITAGRRVVGSTFIVPIISAAYDSDGTLSAANVTVGTNAANAYVAAAPFAVIWSRPTDARAGATSLINGGFTPDRVSWLRTRRT
jgi:hypothetical protein